jgi:O-antigen/teichoic acid export membrane protein
LRVWSPLPSGATAIGYGLVVNGIATYGFLIIARRALGDDTYGGLAVLWGLVYILGPGLFQPLEQEVARATADRASRGLGSAPVLVTASRIGAIELAVVVFAVLVAWPLGLDGLLDHRISLLVSLILALVAFAAAELVRGVLSGRHRFAAYGLYFAAEGGTRLLLAATLAILSVELVGAYAVTLAAAFAVATVVCLGRDRPFVRPGPDATVRDLTPALGVLLAASLSEAFILNVGPVALVIVGGDSLGADAPGVFLNGLIIARVPLFFFQAVKASLLPHLASLAGRHDLQAFRDLQLRLLGAVAAVAALAALGGGLVGPWIVERVFGDELGRVDMAMLATSGGGLMVMLSLALGLIALGHAHLAVAGWVVGVVVFPIGIQLADDPFLRVESALVASVAAGSLVTGLLLGLEYKAHAATGRLRSARPKPTEDPRSPADGR